MRRIFLILGLSVVLVFGLLFYQYQLQQREAAELQVYQAVMQEKMTLIYQQAQDWSKPIHVPIQDQRLQDDYQIIANFVLTQVIQNAEARNAYLRALEAAQWPRFLQIERLDQDRQHNFRETEQMLKQVHAITERYQQQSQLREQQALEQAKALPIKARFRKQLAQSLRESHESDQTYALFALELQVLTKADAMFDILKRDKWVRKNKTFMFENAQAVKQFNALYKDVLSLNVQMERIKKQNIQAVEQKL